MVGFCRLFADQSFIESRVDLFEDRISKIVHGCNHGVTNISSPPSYYYQSYSIAIPHNFNSNLENPLGHPLENSWTLLFVLSSCGAFHQPLDGFSFLLLGNSKLPPLMGNVTMIPQVDSPVLMAACSLLSLRRSTLIRSKNC